jgi:CheY-like chemotaxis protein
VSTSDGPYSRHFLFALLRKTMTRHILIVEDNHDLRTIFGRLLNHLGYKSVVVGSGTEAIASVALNTPDLVLLDLRLPDMPGYRVAQAILALADAAHIPIIGVSAYNTPEERENVLKAGMVDYLQKPILLEELKKVIEQYV